MPGKIRIPKPRVYQLKVTIKGIRPPVWRRVRVPGDITLFDLHVIIQKLFGWYNCHLHEFRIDGAEYGNPQQAMEFGDEFSYTDEKTTVLRRVVRRAGKRFRYAYDFGDDWQHEVLVEKIEPAGPGDRMPVCIAGRRHRPPEDCGGPWGYAEFLEAIRNPDHERHEEMMEWGGVGFDPDDFNIDAVNAALASDDSLEDDELDWV